MFRTPSLKISFATTSHFFPPFFSESRAIPFNVVLFFHPSSLSPDFAAQVDFLSPQHITVGVLLFVVGGPLREGKPPYLSL